PGDPLEPTGSVTKNPDGTQSVEVACEVTEAVCHGTMDGSGAEALLRRHFLPTDVDGGSSVTVTVQSMKNAAGNQLSAIDTSRAADYLITYLVRDAAGNSTTVRLTYHLVASHVPGVIVTPDPGTDLVPRPGDDPLSPKPRPIDPPYPPEVAPDGTQHAVIEDAMRVPVQQGKTLALADARSLMLRRYSFTPEGGGAMTELSLALADAQGRAVNAIDLSRPGSWLITWKVADVNGNTVTIRLRYLVTSDAPAVTPKPGEGDGNGDGNGGTPGGNPGGSDGRDPLPPSQVTVDPETGLTHAIINDSVTVVTNPSPLTADAMADLMLLRYNVQSALADGKLSYGAVHLYNAAGQKVSQIDRAKPGDWRAEQVITDSAGNTTTIRLAYLVREGSIGGTVGGDDDGNGGGSGTDDGSGNGAGSSAGAGSRGDGSGASSGSRWSSMIHQLPQTGGILGPCPLHILFVLIMVLASAYTLMRLRQEAAERDERRRRDAEWEEFRREAVR
ncbi:hypothetical protein VJ918_09635, partial [Adlercreutzia sp. R21]|uniref:hypothetical protein n=1 Tax=Adlercreutzia wanghongyangiae TaxID=3111451 RepID=UPI002DB99458